MADTFEARLAKALANAPPQAAGTAVINLGAMRCNYRKMSAMALPAETAAVVKADAYGLGAGSVLPALEREGCGTAFVATLSEAQTARALSPSIAIYVLDGLFPRTAPLFAGIEARPVLGSLEEVIEWAAFCQAQGKPYPAAIHIDTGMTRLGLPEADARRLAADTGLHATFSLCLLMSHLACAETNADPKNESQRGSFVELAALFPAAPRSLANSAGTFLGPAFHFDLIRPGIALCGGRPNPAASAAMEPVVWVFGRIAEVHWADAGSTVGYGATQTVKRRTRIATVTAGYADGYLRSVSASDGRPGPSGYIGPHRLPLLGRVSMDLITFDATDVPEAAVNRGGWIELIGGHVTIDDFAEFAGTISYEVLTSLGRRHHRVYLDE